MLHGYIKIPRKCYLTKIDIMILVSLPMVSSYLRTFYFYCINSRSCNIWKHFSYYWTDTMSSSII